MDTYRLRYFCTIAETGSLTKAAEILGISHSGLSKAVATLESETNFELFRPQGRGLEITEQGKWLYLKAQEILKIESEIKLEPKLELPTLRFGLSEVLALFCVKAIVAEIQDPMTILETDVGELESKILSGELDFGFTFAPQPRPEIEYLELCEVRFNSFAHIDLLKRESADQIPFAIPATQLPSNPMGFKVRDGWPTDIKRSPKYSVSQLSIALELFKSGICAIYMPNFATQLLNVESDKFQKIPEHKKAESKRKIYLVKAKNSEETKAMKKVSKVVRKICNE